MQKVTKKCCGMCKNCTRLYKFNTLSLKGEPTMGRCPHWTQSKSVLLSLDYCDNFDLRDELSGPTSDVRAKEEELEQRKEMLKKVREDFASNNEPILPTLPYGKPKKKTKKAKKS